MAHAGGRPTKYDSSNNELIYKLCLLGATDAQMADILNVCLATFSNWKVNYPELLDTLKKGKEIADAEIAHALYHRAKGYSHPDVKIFCNAEGKVTKVNDIKHYPPDTAAAFIWLKNRAGWRDKVEVSKTEEININITVSEDDLKERLQLLKTSRKNCLN